jgi:hypothetical protein
VKLPRILIIAVQLVLGLVQKDVEKIDASCVMMDIVQIVMIGLLLDVILVLLMLQGLHVHVLMHIIQVTMLVFHVLPDVLRAQMGVINAIVALQRFII